MITQQQVYDYLKEKGVEVLGTFDADKEIYTTKQGKEYEVIFLNKQLGSFVTNKDKLEIGTKNFSLEEVVGRFIHETVHVDFCLFGWEDEIEEKVFSLMEEFYPGIKLKNPRNEK